MGGRVARGWGGIPAYLASDDIIRRVNSGASGTLRPL